jgi:protein SCO1/2
LSFSGNDCYNEYQYQRGISRLGIRKFRHLTDSNGEIMNHGSYRPAGPRSLVSPLRAVLPALVLAACLLGAIAAPAQEPAGAVPETVDFEEQLGGIIPGDIILRDEEGNPVDMAAFLDKPTILNFVYYECPGICTPLLNEIADILGKTNLDPGKTPFQLLSVSFEPNDSPAMAKEKRANYLKQVGRPLPEDTWRFFTGDAENIRRMTEAVGFGYKRAGGEYIHPGGVIMVSPERKIVRYLYGTQFLPFDFEMGVYEASQGNVTPTTARLLNFCFSFDPVGRTYAFNLARVIGSVMLISVVFFGIFLYFSTRRSRQGEAS